MDVTHLRIVRSEMLKTDFNAIVDPIIEIFFVLPFQVQDLLGSSEVGPNIVFVLIQVENLLFEALLGWIVNTDSITQRFNNIAGTNLIGTHLRNANHRNFDF